MVSEKAYQKLRRMIYRGQLRPGTRIVERDLATRLGVSRIPLREGLVRLETEGLVRTIPNSATYVADLSTTDILEILSMRLLLEPMASRLAALRDGRRLANQLERICRHMPACVKKHDIPRLNQLDCQFHFAIVRASQHKRLIRSYECTHVQILDLGPAGATPGVQSIEMVMEEHEEIRRCIAAADATAAQRATYNHIRNAMQNTEKAFGMRFADIC